jgi:hypothetical protein
LRFSTLSVNAAMKVPFFRPMDTARPIMISAKVV